MAIIQCSECRGQVSSSAAACPHCGAKAKPKTSLATWMIGALFAAGVGSMVVSSANNRPAPTQAAKPKPTAAEVARNTWAARVGKTIHDAAYDPQSLEWVSARVAPDASFGCITYRAKNAFGAKVINKVGIYGDKVETGPAAMQTICSAEIQPDLIDVTPLVRLYSR